MKKEIFKIGTITIVNKNGYHLKIQRYSDKREREVPTGIISIKSGEREWRIKNEEIITSPHDYKERTGIWFEKEPDLSSIFTRVSLFEESMYLFQFLPPESEIENQFKKKKKEKEKFKEYLNQFFKTPIKWISKKSSLDYYEEESYKIIRQYKDNHTWILNFRAYTGKLKLKKSIINKDINDIEIIPRKLTKENYTLILNKLTVFISQIFFKFKSPTEISVSRDFTQSEHEKEILYIFPKTILLETIMKEISMYFYGLRNQLNTKFVYLKEQIENYKFTDPTTIEYIQTISYPNNLVLVTDIMLLKKTYSIEVNGRNFSFNNLITTSRNLSFDTQENRFIKFVLKLLLFELSHKKIEEILIDLGKGDKIEEYKSDLTEKIKFLESEGVNDLQRIPYNSQMLQKNSYYRRFLEYFMWLQFPTVFNIDELFSIDIKQMDLLYEYFCLYAMKEALDLIAQEKKILKPFSIIPDECFEVKDKEESLNFRKIEYIIFKYRTKNDEEVQLIFKTEGLNTESSLIYREIDGKNFRIPYSSSKGIMKKPDYALLKIHDNKILINKDGKNSLVILDAKYRLDNAELWDKMHLYKDSLGAIGSIFINPFTHEKDKEYSKQLFTPYGIMEKTKLKTDIRKERFQKAKSYGFVSRINLLGLSKLKKDTFESAVMDFKDLFEKIITLYF